MTKADLSADIARKTAQIRRIIARHPLNPVLHNKLGVMLGAASEFAKSLAVFDRAISLCPTFGEAWLNRSVSLSALGRMDEALEAAVHACRLVPDYRQAEAKSLSLAASTGRALDLQHLWPKSPSKRWNAFSRKFARFSGSKDQFVEVPPSGMPSSEPELRALIQEQPGNVTAMVALGYLLNESDRIVEAECFLQYALSYEPDNLTVAIVLASVLEGASRLDESIKVLETAARNGAKGPAFYPEILRLRALACEWSDFDRMTAAAIDAIHRDPKCCRPFTALTISSDPSLLRACADAISVRLKRASDPMPFNSRKKRGDRLTIGYLSADYRQHAVATLVAEMFELHDRQTFRINAYSIGPDDDSDIGKRIRKGADRFIDMYGRSGREIVNTVAGDGVDILVDLTGWTRLGRPDVMAQKPAPIRVNYLGYPGTLGSDVCDYVIVDQIVAPAEHAAYFDERLVYLPTTYQMNDRRRPWPEASGSRADYGLPMAGTVFCNFGGNSKMTPVVFNSWMKILRSVPGSVLWLMGSMERAEQNLRRAAIKRGVAGERLFFAPLSKHDVHLARYHFADVSLDTLPYGAHTTCSEALWMGCPHITLQGDAFAGRVSASLLTAAGLNELVTDTVLEYEALAIDLGRQPERLAAVRHKLNERRSVCALFDTPSQVRLLEAAYRKMYDLYVSGSQPMSFVAGQ